MKHEMKKRNGECKTKMKMRMDQKHDKWNWEHHLKKKTCNQTCKT